MSLHGKCQRKMLQSSTLKHHVSYQNAKARPQWMNLWFLMIVLSPLHLENSYHQDGRDRCGSHIMPPLQTQHALPPLD